ncbi:UV-stimulated scaffold protein A isoform X1 [Hippoglossus hippoglossus]|uniref:UV-stimulated scaffold protein A isoform X1 n=1 Tax=Hippoglossus hippoglossus TaxID=8267 RepID=UPI00148DE102|nr:UV-stimulated scaffold protein A isoform X1 [Hippoglossus hippoglossus]XP_034454642.1 UV-stimulated scaffold protein A isoform X1 [Hippoglossus hippoglossus]
MHTTVMELSQRERLSELVEELTTSGQPQLNQDKMKKIKKICKVSNDCIDHLYHLVMAQLNQDHCEVRLSAFQITSELFSRSHHFRTLLVDNFQEFLDLTVETDLDQPLPPPKEVARKLRSLAIQTIQLWQASHGTAYKKLALGYHFLKQVKKVDFQDAEARTVAERGREEERQRRMERIYKERVEAACKDMEESYEGIEATLTEMESCLRLLFPEFGLTDIHSANNSPSGSQRANECPPDDGQPCCSKDVRDNMKEGAEESREVKNGNGKKENMSQKEEREPGNEQKEEKKDEIEKVLGEGEEEEDTEEEEGGSSEEEEEKPFDEDLFIRNSGLISHSYSLDLNLSPGFHVKESEDNEAVVSTVIDLHRLITTKHLPAVQSWVQVFTKAGAGEQLLRRALDLKRSLEAALQKHKELHIDYKTRVRRVMKASSDGQDEEDDDDDDDDFDEVPEKEGYEPHIPEHLRSEYGLDPTPSTSAAPVTAKLPAKRPSAPAPHSSSHSSTFRRMKRLTEEEQDPTCAAATVRLLRQSLPLSVEPSSSSSSSGPSSSQSSSDQKAVDAPVVPFGLDLYYWGQEQPNAGKIIKAASQHQFWVPIEVEEEVENEQLLAESKSRYISFPGSFTPVSHYCRAPLGNGKLCQRQDRLKCPFHGRIIPRDPEGRPCSREDQVREEQEERRKRTEQPDWRDAELMRDIEAATGEDLGSNRVGKKGKGKGKKKKFPNLSDLKQSANTSRSRLEKRVFNKSSMRRVAQVMSKADGKKHDKFSNQFNYAFN